MEEEVKVAVLETRLENFETLVSRLDSAIEKIAEVNNNVSRMLAVHEQRISKQEEIDEVLFDKIDKLRDKMDSDHDSVTKRLSLLEKKTLDWYGSTSSNPCHNKSTINQNPETIDFLD
jgi:Rad3-related DNA helicase